METRKAYRVPRLEMVRVLLYQTDSASQNPESRIENALLGRLFPPDWIPMGFLTSLGNEQTKLS